MEASTGSASGSPTGPPPRTCTSNIRSNQSTARRKPAVSVRTADMRTPALKSRPPNGGEPIQYDELRIEHDQGNVEIVVYHRAILLFSTASEAIRRIHQTCCRLEDLAARCRESPPLLLEPDLDLIVASLRGRGRRDRPDPSRARRAGWCPLARGCRAPQS